MWAYPGILNDYSVDKILELPKTVSKSMLAHLGLLELYNFEQAVFEGVAWKTNILTNRYVSNRILSYNNVERISCD